MKISTRSQYAITAILELALKQDKKSVTLLEIAKMENISLSYLEQLFTQLRQHGLVKGRRGPGGGYTLARDPSEITIAEIVTAVDNKTKAVNISDTNEITSGHLWQHLSQKLRSFMSHITVAEIMDVSNSTDHGATVKNIESYKKLA